MLSAMIECQGLQPEKQILLFGSIDLACRVYCILRLLLTLILLSLSLFVVFLSSPFCADRTNGRRLKGLKPKEQRAWHTGIPVSLFFVQELLLQYPSVEKSLPLKLFLLIFGAPELVRLALNKENITLPHCCTSSPVSKNQKGLSYGIQRCRPWNISVANGNPRYGQTGIFALYQRTMSSRRNEVTRYLFFPLQKHQHRLE